MDLETYLSSGLVESGSELLLRLRCDSADITMNDVYIDTWNAKTPGHYFFRHPDQGYWTAPRVRVLSVMPRDGAESSYSLNQNTRLQANSSIDTLINGLSSLTFFAVVRPNTGSGQKSFFTIGHPETMFPKFLFASDYQSSHPSNAFGFMVNPTGVFDNSTLVRVLISGGEFALVSFRCNSISGEKRARSTQPFTTGVPRSSTFTAEGTTATALGPFDSTESVDRSALYRPGSTFGDGNGGDIAELFLINGELSDTELFSVEYLLSDYWGIPLSLDHPYHDVNPFEVPKFWTSFIGTTEVTP